MSVVVNEKTALTNAIAAKNRVSLVIELSSRGLLKYQPPPIDTNYIRSAKLI
jgi:hypothetical protein